MILISNATIVNEGKSFKGSVLIEEERIKAVYTDVIPSDICYDTFIDAEGLLNTRCN